MRKLVPLLRECMRKGCEERLPLAITCAEAGMLWYEFGDWRVTEFMYSNITPDEPQWIMKFVWGKDERTGHPFLLTIDYKVRRPLTRKPFLLWYLARGRVKET